MKFFHHLLIIAAASFVYKEVHAQNLVLDPGFEQNTGCPVQVSDLSALPAWWAPNMATTDYYHSCSPAYGSNVPFNMAGEQWPHSGEGYVGMITQANDLRYAELVQGRLAEPLRKGAYYRVSYYASLAEISRIKDTRLGVCFTQDSTATATRATPGCPKGQGILNLNVPTVDDMDGWVLVTGMYKAKGGERFITLGNLLGSEGRKDQKKNKMTRTRVKDVMGYYYVDDVTVEKARNRTDTMVSRWAAPSRDELVAGRSLVLAPASAIFNEGTSAFKDIKAMRNAAQQDTGSVPFSAMLEYLGDLLLREPGLSMEIAVHSAPMADTSTAGALSMARAKTVVDRFLASGVRKEQITAIGVATSTDAPVDHFPNDEDGCVMVRITGMARDEATSELPD